MWLLPPDAAGVCVLPGRSGLLLKRLTSLDPTPAIT